MATKQIRFYLTFNSQGDNLATVPRDYELCTIGSTGTPLIGRFLGPGKNRPNRNPSYIRGVFMV